MSRLLILACLVIVAGGLPHAAAQAKKVGITQTWNGSVSDEKAPQPEAIVSAKGLEAVWKAWKVKGGMPKIDFSKNMLVAIYSVGSSLNMTGATLDDKGNLEVQGINTDDIRSGFRYVLGVVSREGVKTVNKKELPRD